MTETWGCLISSTLEKLHAIILSEISGNLIIRYFFIVIILMDATLKNAASKVSSSHTGLIFACFVCRMSFTGGDHFISQNFYEG